MESIVITWRELLIVVALILAVYVAEMLLLLRKGGNSPHRLRWMGVLQEKQTELELRHEIERIKERLTLLEAAHAQLPEVDISEASPYQHAIQLARQGRDVASISESCGISRAEAELIVSMHGARD